MSDELYQAFRIYQMEGLIGLNEEQLYETIKDYNDEKKKDAIDAYMKVTRDPVLKSMISDLSSYDLNNISIKELYSERKRKMTTETIPTEAAPVQEKKDSTSSFLEDTKALQEKIAKNPEDIANNPVIEPEPTPVVEQELPNQSVGLQQKNNRTMKMKLTNNKLNQVGYANIVLMSIIVIIIVAIICVFIFLD